MDFWFKNWIIFLGYNPSWPAAGSSQGPSIPLGQWGGEAEYPGGQGEGSDRELGADHCCYWQVVRNFTKER